MPSTSPPGGSHETRLSYDGLCGTGCGGFRNCRKGLEKRADSLRPEGVRRISCDWSGFGLDSLFHSFLEIASCQNRLRKRPGQLTRPVDRRETSITANAGGSDRGRNSCQNRLRKRPGSLLERDDRDET